MPAAPLPAAPRGSRSPGTRSATASGTRASRLVILTGLDVRAYRGGEKYAASLGRELAARGVEVRLLSKVDPNEHHRLPLADVPAVLRLPVEFYRLFWLPLVPPVPLTPRQLLRAFQWSDTVYTMEVTPRFVALVVFLGKLLRRRVVLGLHHPTLADDLAAELRGPGRRRWGSGLFREVLRAADAIHVLNAHQAETLAAIGLRDNVSVVPNYTTRAPPASVAREGTAFEILFVGPLEREQKGIDLLAEVAGRLLPHLPQARLTVVGTGRDLPLVERMVADHPGQVRRLGFVPEERLEELYAASHALCLTSRAEAFPAVAMEGYAHGLPVVAFAVPGLEDLSVVYPAGRVPPFDTAAFADRLLALYRLWRDDRPAYERLRQGCRSEVLARFGVDVQLPRLAGILGVRLRSDGGPTP